MFLFFKSQQPAPNPTITGAKFISAFSFGTRSCEQRSNKISRKINIF